MTTVVGVINATAERLVDEGFDVHSQPKLLAAFNLAVKALVVVRPEESTKVEELTLVAGSRQMIPAAGLKLITVLGIRERTSEAMFKDDPGWQFAPSTDEFEFWTADDRNPRAFWVYPMAKANDVVNVEYSLPPEDIAITNYGTDSQALPVNDIYANPIIEYMLYLRMGTDATNLAAKQQALMHKKAFSDLLGLKWSADKFMAEPREKGTGNG